MTGSVPITALYVPGDRPDRIERAMVSGADVVIVDLEDAVAPAGKAAARLGLRSIGDAGRVSEVQVRITEAGSPWHSDDLAAVAALDPSIGVRVPKLESAHAVEAVMRALPGRRVHALIESALGVERTLEIAEAGVASIALGEADLRSQLGIPTGPDGEPALQWTRSRLVNAAAAAGLPAPMMSVYAQVRDLDGLAASCAVGRALGLLGRTAIHPTQLPVIEAAFAPTDVEIARAREVLDRVGSAASAGVGTVVLDSGEFLDAAMVAGARRVIAIAERRRP